MNIICALCTRMHQSYVASLGVEKDPDQAFVGTNGCCIRCYHKTEVNRILHGDTYPVSVTNVTGGCEWGLQRDTLSEAVVSLRTVVTFVTWLISRTEFLVWNLFYNDIFLDVLFKRLDGERRLSRCLPSTSTFVPNDRSQCLYCVLPIMRCAFGAHLDVGLAERRTPCRFVISRFLPFF